MDPEDTLKPEPLKRPLFEWAHEPLGNFAALKRRRPQTVNSVIPEPSKNSPVAGLPAATSRAEWRIRPGPFGFLGFELGL